MADHLRSITDFIPWLPSVSSTAELQVIQTVTGHEEVPVDGFNYPADGTDFAHVVALVELHKLRDLLCLVAEVDMAWWRIVANWDRLVGLLDAAQPNWRRGAKADPAALNDALTTLYSRFPGPRRIGMDMDGPLTGFDQMCWDLAADGGWHFDIESPQDQVHRYITDHIIDERQRAALRAVIDSPGFYRALPPTPGAQEGVEALLSAGHEVIVVSTPHHEVETCEGEKRAWLAEHFPMLTTYSFTNDKATGFYAGANGILLDDAIVHSQVGYASWTPVSFGVPFNGPGSEWGRYPRWSWGDPIERLSW